MPCSRPNGKWPLPPPPRAGLRERGRVPVCPPPHVAHRYVLGGGAFPQLAGVAYLASCPPSGNKQMVMRFLTRDLWLSLKVTW